MTTQPVTPLLDPAQMFQIAEKAHAPSRIEIDIHDVVVEGTLPKEIDGAFYRVSSDRQYPAPFDGDISLNEDGLVTVLRIKDGRADLRHRYVHTDRWKAEHAAGRSLFGKYRNPFSDDPSVAGVERTLANTTPIVHAGVLLAMKEDGRAYAMDPITLENKGPWDFHGTFKGKTFTAHPKIDPDTGQMIAFGYANHDLYSSDLIYYEISPEGRVTHSVEFDLPYISAQHDFGLTRDFAIWPIMPLVGGGVERLQKGEPYWGWDPTLPVYLAVLPRGGSAEDVRWFTAPNQFAGHVMNAFNDGTVIHLDLCRSEGNSFAFFPEYGKEWDPSTALNHLTRWSVDYEKGGQSFESAAPFLSANQLNDFIGEFPRTDDRYQTKPYRHGWMVRYVGMTSNAIGHIDLQANQAEVFETPIDTPLQEPCFIPRAPDAPEGDGYIIQFATRTEVGLTDILLFRATDIAAGPIATLKLPVRLRSGWHGCWADAAQLAPPL